MDAASKTTIRLKIYYNDNAQLELFNYVIFILYYNNDDTLASMIIPDFIDNRNGSSENDTIIFQL